MGYAKVIIDTKSRFTDELYTYRCDLPQVSVGSKVSVPFGRGKAPKTGYVCALLDEPDGEFKNMKSIQAVDEEFSLPAEIVELALWMRDRYLSRYMDCLRLFLPVGKPLKSGKSRDPFKDREGEAQPVDALTEEQTEVLAQINDALNQGRHEIFLLHGVTGSGKTEVYMQAIAGCLERGQKAILLVPEISLTPQITDRLMARFGADRLAILHSGLSQGERHDEWMRIRGGTVDIVVGARSAVFAPLENIGLIILDEEHESTYKSDMSPKYDTLEVAIKRVKPVGGSLILGSATPSVVSYERAKQGVYKKLTLKNRYNKVPLPKVTVADMRQELSQGNTSIFSAQLAQAMDDTLQKGERIILFMNRRGYQTFVSCRSCGHVMTCPTCGISLTYHKGENALVCHYCEHKEPLPKVCPSCGSKDIKGFGTGTEKVVEEVERLFPAAATDRLDLDTMRRKGSLDRVLKNFARGKTDILIGTQVVAKGLDYRNVGLVGVVSCDVLLNIPDYRAPERAFQLITQAAGRSGRGDEQGRVIIQTYTPEHYAVKAAKNHDYDAFFEEESKRRKQYRYPPFGHLIQVVFGAKEAALPKQTALAWRDFLVSQGAPALDLLVPEGKIFQREETEHRECLLIHADQDKRAWYLKQLAGLKEQARQNRSELGIVVDVNPYSLWRI